MIFFSNFPHRNISQLVGRYDIIQGPNLWLDYGLYLFLVLDSTVSLVCEVEVDKLFSFLLKIDLGKHFNLIKV